MPAWHGDTIAFISNRDRSPRDLYGFALYTMSPDGSNQRWRAADLHPYSGLSWSPDGRQVAYAAGRECFRWGIDVLDLQTKSARRLTNLRDPTSSSAGRGRTPCWVETATIGSSPISADTTGSSAAGVTT